MTFDTGSTYARTQYAPRVTFRPDIAATGDAYAWEAYVPPTRIEHFDGGDAEESPVDALHGETYWSTFAEAAAHLLALPEQVETAAADITAHADVRPYSPFHTPETHP